MSKNMTAKLSLKNQEETKCHNNMIFGCISDWFIKLKATILV